MAPDFEWDAKKAEENLKKHGVAFEEALTVFADPLANIFDDPNHSADERRELIIGQSGRRRLLIVCFRDRGYRTRIIGAEKRQRVGGGTIEKSTARMWIAEQEGLLVGYVLAMVHHLPENPFCQARHWCEIDQIAVDPRYRRQGIARSLILKAIAEARTEGIRDIEVTSWSFNEETHQVFRRLGFVPKTVRFELKPSPL